MKRPLPETLLAVMLDGIHIGEHLVVMALGLEALVQRCQMHKLRNVLGHLPSSLHPSVRQAMRDAYRSASEQAAQKRLRALASQLQTTHPSAERSLLESLEETLTVKRLELPQVLQKSLASTNMIKILTAVFDNSPGASNAGGQDTWFYAGWWPPFTKHSPNFGAFGATRICPSSSKHSLLTRAPLPNFVKLPNMPINPETSPKF